MNPRLALLAAALCAPCWALAAAGQAEAAKAAPVERASTAPARSADSADSANSADAAKRAPAEPSRSTPTEPAVQHIVVQGRDTHIDELRVRGQTRRIVVTGAGGTRYEVIPADGLRDLPDAAGTPQGAAGKRVWRVLNF